MGIEKLGNKLIFIVSQPRSGSTLLQTLLGQHPDVFTYSESWFLLRPLLALKENNSVAPSYGARSCTQALQDLLEKCEKGQNTYYSLVREMVENLYSSCLKVSGKKFFLDKSPPYYLILPEIARIFPEAKIIILLRNPIATLSSTSETWFEGKSQLILNHPVHNHSLFVAPVAIANFIKKNRNGCYVIKYEDIVTSPEDTLTRLCEYLDISFVEEMLSYVPDTPRGRLGDPDGLTKNTKPTASYLNKWKSTYVTYSNYRFALSYLDYLGADIFSTMGYDYNEMKKILSGIWNQHSSVKKIVLRSSFWINAILSIVNKTLKTLISSSMMELKIEWNKYHHHFPPDIPDFSRLESRWSDPITKMLAPRMPLKTYWPELFNPSDDEE